MEFLSTTSFAKKAVLGTLLSGAAQIMINGGIDEDSIMSAGSTMATQYAANNIADVTGRMIGNFVAPGSGASAGEFLANAVNHFGGDMVQGLGKIIPNAMGYATEGGTNLYRDANNINNMIIDLYTQSVGGSKLSSAFTVAKNVDKSYTGGLGTQFIKTTTGLNYQSQNNFQKALTRDYGMGYKGMRKYFYAPATYISDYLTGSNKNKTMGDYMQEQEDIASSKLHEGGQYFSSQQLSSLVKGIAAAGVAVPLAKMFASNRKERKLRQKQAKKKDKSENIFDNYTIQDKFNRSTYLNYFRDNNEFMDDVDMKSTAANTEFDVSLSKFYESSKEFKDKKFITHDIVINQLQLPTTEQFLVELPVQAVRQQTHNNASLFDNNSAYNKVGKYIKQKLHNGGMHMQRQNQHGDGVNRFSKKLMQSKSIKKQLLQKYLPY